MSQLVQGKTLYLITKLDSHFYTITCSFHVAYDGFHCTLILQVLVGYHLHVMTCLLHRGLGLAAAFNLAGLKRTFLGLSADTKYLRLIQTDNMRTYRYAVCFADKYIWQGFIIHFIGEGQGLPVPVICYVMETNTCII